jgi:hypothetical protein
MCSIVVYGDLDAVDLIEEEAAKADIVYHFANCDHEPSAHAIAKGLARRESQVPGYWIHTSGTLILGWETMDLADYGNRLDKVFDDWEHVKELTVSCPAETCRPGRVSNMQSWRLFYSSWD